MEKQHTGGPKYLTVRQVVENQLYPSEAGLRWLLFRRAENGLSAAVHRCGRRLLISERRFISWMEQQREEVGT